MATRLEVALPAAVAFVFGTACGGIAGWLAATGGQLQPDLSRPLPLAGSSSAPPPAATSAEDAERERQLRENLDRHLELVESDPGNVKLWRSIAEFQLGLNLLEDARASYEKAVTLAEGEGDDEELGKILMGQALLLSEAGENVEALDLLDRSSALMPESIRPRLMAAFVCMTQLMPNPPPGYDRKDAVERAEKNLAEVLLLSPGHPEALRMQGMIDNVRRSLGQTPP
ncbi:MAG: hypothetical protein AAF533_00650 [Acidobacteriota bacterium]